MPRAIQTRTRTRAPAFSSPMAAADDVLLLGTAAYTSPEQARGNPVDARADVWAFGCVLYEMLTGTRAFPGVAAAEVLDAVQGRDVDWTLLPPTTPTYVRWLLQQSLQRDLTERFRDIGDARLLLATAIEARKNPPPSPSSPNRMRWVAGLVTVAVAALTVWMSTARVTPPAPPLKIFDISETIGATQPALSPDGLMVAYGRPDGLWVRRLDSATPTRVVTAPDIGSVAWAPTNDALAYFVGANVHVARVDGAEQRIVWRPTERIAYSRSDVGLVWSSNALYLPVSITNRPAIARVPLGGGEPLVIQPLNNTSPFAIYRFPVVLDGGETILVNPGISGEDRFDFGTVWALRGTQAKQVLSFPESGVIGMAYLREARVLLVSTNDNQRNALWAAAFDRERLTAGEPRPILDGRFPSSPAANGDIALITGVRPRLPLLRRFDANAREIGVFPQHRLDLRNLELAPGGRHLALRAMSTLGSAPGLWIYDLERAVETFVASVRGVAFTAWSPDARRLAVTHWALSDSEGALDVIDVSGGRRGRMADRVRGKATWTPDGRRLLFVSGTGTATELLSVPTEGQGAAEPQALASIESLQRVSLSPSGRILAYVAGSPGRGALMLAPFPALSPRRQVAGEGVWHLQWSPRGDELWFGRDNELLAVPVAMTRAGEPTSGTPRSLFKPPPGLSLFDSRRGRVFATSDGKEFWMADERPEGEPRVSVIQNIEPFGTEHHPLTPPAARLLWWSQGVYLPPRPASAPMPRSRAVRVGHVVGGELGIVLWVGWYGGDQLVSRRDVAGPGRFRAK